MGDEVSGTVSTPEGRRRYRERLRSQLLVLRRLLDDDAFTTDDTMTGMEVELALVDPAARPSRANREVLATLGDPDVTTELGSHTIEVNVPPSRMQRGGAIALEADLRTRMEAADVAARAHGARVVMIGIVPTLLPDDQSEGWMTRSPRYRALDEAVRAQRGEDLLLDIRGEDERLLAHAPSIAPEAACTSVQLHLQVSPEQFAAVHNAAQLLAGAQVALAANSPFYAGRRLWDESRLPVFAQSTDSRPPELAAQGVRERVLLGDAWTTSAYDLFEDAALHYPPLLPELAEEDALRVLSRGGVPRLAELKMQNGTVWRWNRPVYDVVDGSPHLRVENRLLPSGPTVVDVAANAAFWFGAVRALALGDDRPWEGEGAVPFSLARDALDAGARRGLRSRLPWPDARTGRVEERDADDLVLRTLLPLVHEGLASWGVDEAACDRYLGVLEHRASTRQTGAQWQHDAVAAAEARGADRRGALHGMLGRYAELMRQGEPVGSWPAG
ncbi:glutamate-cysteine ligase family protein [Pseudokineococcus basanitobsidens]|uniref:Glutamate-cysteine ligase family protein n=1 Tax=Pseudokineococcus basanitobsidens TaxID=1926649 RepID=A0ABU8RIW5_9ACTN